MIGCQYIVFSTGYEKRLWDKTDWEGEYELWDKINTKYKCVYHSVYDHTDEDYSDDISAIKDSREIREMVNGMYYVIFRNLLDDGQFFGLIPLLKQLDYCSMYNIDDIRLIDDGYIVVVIMDAESG